MNFVMRPQILIYFLVKENWSNYDGFAKARVCEVGKDEDNLKERF
jgi:hypothetical protein